MLQNPFISQLVVFIVIGTLLGYSPFSAMIIKRTRRSSESHRWFFTKAALLSLLFALVIVSLNDLFYPFLPWGEFPRWFWYLAGTIFVLLGVRQFFIYQLKGGLSILYNAIWYVLAGILLTLFETKDPQGTANLTTTIIVIFLAVVARYCYWKNLHHHTKESKIISLPEEPDK